MGILEVSKSEIKEYQNLKIISEMVLLADLPLFRERPILHQRIIPGGTSGLGNKVRHMNEKNQ